MHSNAVRFYSHLQIFIFFLGWLALVPLIGCGGHSGGLEDEPLPVVATPIPSPIPTPVPSAPGKYAIAGTGTMKGQTSSVVDSSFIYVGIGELDEGVFTFTVDQEATNPLGKSIITSAGSFDIDTGLGSQTVSGCTGEPMICAPVLARIEANDATAEYNVENVIVSSDGVTISWDHRMVVDVAPFGDADSDSSYTAIRGAPADSPTPTPEPATPSPAPSPPPAQSENLPGTYTITGTGALTADSDDSFMINTDYTFTGSGKLEGNIFTFSLDQQMDNEMMGENHMYRDLWFDITTGQGKQTITSCKGKAAICDPAILLIDKPYDIVFDVDVSADQSEIKWSDVFKLEVEGFGSATSESEFSAIQIPTGETPDPEWYQDADGDGYGNPDAVKSEAEKPEGYVAVANVNDCDDADASSYPGNEEVIDRKDNDCDDSVDEGFWYQDNDGDGYGNSEAVKSEAEKPEGYVAVADVNDCDDTDANNFPGNEEVLDEQDNNCNGDVDEDIVQKWYQDYDGDGYGNASKRYDAVESPPGYVTDNTDCDDANKDVNPNSAEVEDGKDNNCDGMTDEGFTAQDWYKDGDGDGYGDPDAMQSAEVAPAGYVADKTDCNDADVDVNPGVVEMPNDDLDNNCNGEVDEPISYTIAGTGTMVGQTKSTADSESTYASTTATLEGKLFGYEFIQFVVSGGGTMHAEMTFTTSFDIETGIGTQTVMGCTGTNAICNSVAAQIEGGESTSTVAIEVDNFDIAADGVATWSLHMVVDVAGIGLADDNSTYTATPTGEKNWYEDADGDGYGKTNVVELALDAPIGYVLEKDDCDDADANNFPGNEEVQDGKDNNCDGKADERLWYQDADGDGYGNPDVAELAVEVPADYIADNTDCDDTDANNFPGNEEVQDGTDNNCDGDIDETLWYQDADTDGYGNPGVSELAVQAPENYIADNTDCNDDDANNYPGNEEVKDDADNNCDGIVDEGFEKDWYQDGDGDGYGNSAVMQSAVDAPADDYVLDSTDCNDDDVDVNPGVAEVPADAVDNNCDGVVDIPESDWYQDADSDGYGNAEVVESTQVEPAGYVADNSDCDDTDAQVNPGVAEVPADEVDNDCDGEIDEEPLAYTITGTGEMTAHDPDDASMINTAYTFTGSGTRDGNIITFSLVQQMDNPMLGDENFMYKDLWFDITTGVGEQTITLCDAEETICAPAVDLIDQPFELKVVDLNISNLSEITWSDTFDLEIDGFGSATSDSDFIATGEALDSAWYADDDGDGYGDPDVIKLAVATPAGYVADNNDCDDADADNFPGNTEVYDEKDNDCNGIIDDSFVPWYEDADSDGYGNEAVEQWAVAAPAGYVDDNTDCDDADADNFPGNEEVQDEKDNNCNNEIDEDVLTNWYQDLDGDAYGGIDSVTSAVTAPPGYIADGTDCDDADPDKYPGNTEIYDERDNDCNGIIDDNFTLWYQDDDGDGYGNSGAELWDQLEPAGFVVDNTDCNDADPNVNPGVTEVLDDGVDNDCDGEVDIPESDWYQDADGDGYGNSGVVVSAQVAPADYVADNTDCNDGDTDVNPGVTEVPDDGLDNNCNGEIDEDAVPVISYIITGDGTMVGRTNDNLDSTSTYAGTGTLEGSLFTYQFIQSVVNLAGSAEMTFASSFDIATGLGTQTVSDCTPEGAICNSVTTQIDSGESTVDIEVSDFVIAADTGVATWNIYMLVDVPGLGLADDNSSYTAIPGDLDWYEDTDADGYGNPDSMVSAAVALEGYVADNTDCDDDNAEVNPGVAEAPDDGVDNNCNGETDEGIPSDWYEDADADGFGNVAVMQSAVDAPAGYIADNTDCDDTDANNFPGNEEVQDGLDNNCNGQVDEEGDEHEYSITGVGSLDCRDNDFCDSTYIYTGSGHLEGDVFEYDMDQEVNNSLGESHILSSAKFNLTTGLGTQTIKSCTGQKLVCKSVNDMIGTSDAVSDIEVVNVDANDINSISWSLLFEMDTGTTGMADSESHYTAMTSALSVARAGNDQTLTLGEMVRLNGSASTGALNSQINSYKWAFMTRPPASMTVLNNDSIVTPTFIADVEGSYVITLVVTDVNGNVSLPDYVVISIIPELGCAYNPNADFDMLLMLLMACMIFYGRVAMLARK